MVSSSHRCLLRWIGPLALVACFSAAHAQSDLIADLAISIQPPLPAILKPNASGTLLITVRNLGPDDAGFTSQNDHPIVVRTSLQMERPDGGLEVYFLPPESPDGCILIATVIDPMPGGRPQWAYGLFFEPVLADHSASCSVRYQLDPTVTGQQVPIAWRVRTFTETDLNPDNDSVELVFNVGGVEPPAARAVPALHPLGIVLLLLTSLGVGTRALRGRPDPQSRAFNP